MDGLSPGANRAAKLGGCSVGAAALMTEPADTTQDVPDLVPARMLNEFTYCPRLAWLEWVQGDFVDSADTVEGRRHHRRVDQPSGSLPAPEELTEGQERLHARSVHLSSPSAGLVARIDLVEAIGTTVTPIDYKRGEAPDLPEGAWEPERVQLCAQGLILEDNGYNCREGVLYFVGSKQRVTIAFTAELRSRTRELLERMRETMAGPIIPPPLEDSPKCPRCSLVSICLPDEVNLLRLRRDEADEDEPRRLVPARDDALPVYVQAAGTRVGKSGDELTIQPLEGERQSARLAQTSQLALFGSVQLTTQALQAAVGRGIPICYFSTGGWFYAMTTGLTHKNVELRRLQFRAAESPGASLALARRFIGSKIRNSRTFLRRNAEAVSIRSLEALKTLAGQAEEAESVSSLLGIEGAAAREYFHQFSGLLKGDDDAHLAFEFEGRNRRPPKDPVNAMLSLAYAVLAKDLTVVLQAVGFDPFLGFYHRPRYGRPALALDLMEEFRPLVADSVVVNVINTGVVRLKDFIVRGSAYALINAARVRFLLAYERRMDELITHPVFGYRISYRRVLEVQARLLGRYLGGEIPEYPRFETR
jgi:CRISP-associated protein Cas1